MSGSPHTTAPALGNSGGGRALLTTAVHWVYPKRGGQLTPLGSAALSLGRGEECDVVLRGTEASRLHASIRRHGPAWFLEDEQSTNGSFVDGARVERAELRQGAVVRLGEWIGIVVSLPAEHTAAAFGELAPGLWGGAQLARAVEPAKRAASAADLPIVVQGETGSGKECVARAIHAWSGRAGPFAAVNCGALPEALAEGELFGYRKGAFTGADRNNPGHFRAAHGGTLLLDEVVDLAPSVQTKLLRVLEENEVQPLGETRPVRIDVRVVAAAQSPLADAAEQKRFRPDLYARLDGLTLRIPPLRERKEDIVPLFLRFVQERLDRPIELEPKLLETLCLYDWPFNVRELSLLVRNLLTLHAHEPPLRHKHLPERILHATGHGAEHAEDVDANQLAALLHALRKHGGNVAEASREVGISRQRAYRLMEGQGGLDLGELRKPKGAP